MREEQLSAFLAELGLWPLKKSGTSNFSLECLYPHKHDKGTDNHPSATISFDQGESWFRCYGCGTRRPIVKAIMENGLRQNRSTSWVRVAAKYQEIEGKDTMITAVRKMTGPSQVARDCTPGLKAMLGQYPYSEKMLSFLESKNISVASAKRFCLAFAPAGHTDTFLSLDPSGNPVPLKTDCIFIPTLVRTSAGKVVCIGGQGRALDRGHGSKYFTMYSHNVGHYLYAQHLAGRTSGKACFLVEGAFDAIHLWQEGFRAFGIFGLHLSQERCLKLKKMAVTEAVVFLDPDPSGIAASGKVLTTLQTSGIVARAIQYHKHPKDCTAQELDTIAPQTRQKEDT